MKTIEVQLPSCHKDPCELTHFLGLQKWCLQNFKGTLGQCLGQVSDVRTISCLQIGTKLVATGSGQCLLLQFGTSLFQIGGTIIIRCYVAALTIWRFWDDIFKVSSIFCCTICSVFLLFIFLLLTCYYFSAIFVLSSFLPYFAYYIYICIYVYIYIYVYVLDPLIIKMQTEACSVIKKESLVQLFSCEFCEIFKNTFFHKTPPVAASVNLIVI